MYSHLGNFQLYGLSSHDLLSVYLGGTMIEDYQIFQILCDVHFLYMR